MDQLLKLIGWSALIVALTVGMSLLMEYVIDKVFARIGDLYDKFHK